MTGRHYYNDERSLRITQGFHRCVLDKCNVKTWGKVNISDTWESGKPSENLVTKLQVKKYKLILAVRKWTGSNSPLHKNGNRCKRCCGT